jgi:hypothetical protein
MKKNVLKKVPELKSENGTLIGGFSSLLPEQMRKLKGGKRLSNDHCVNEYECTNSDNSYCTNTIVCYSSRN